MKKYLVIGVVLSVLMGCVSQQKQAATTAPVGPAHPVYGKLEEIDGRYQFTEFMAYGSLKNTREPWVRLSDRKPMWRLWEEKLCFFGVSESQKISNTCKTENRRLFHTGRRTRTSAMAEAYMTVLSAGMLQVMRVTGAGTQGAVSLNRELLDQAFVEAAESSSLTLESIARNAKDIAELKPSIDALYELRGKFEALYEDSNQIVTVVNDKTNIEKHQKIDFGRYVKVYEPKYTSVDVQFRNPSLSMLWLSLKFSPLSSIWEEEALAFTCDTFIEKNRGLDARMSCFPTIVKGVYTTALTVDIFSYWRSDLIPKQLDIADRNIRVSIENGGFYLENTSTAYVEVMDLSYNYAGQVVPYDSISGRALSSLAPSQRVRLGGFDNVFTRYNKVSARFKSKAQAVNFKEKYGFSVRYSMNGKIYNLHQTKQFSGYDML